MPWLNLTVETDPDHSDALAEFFQQFSAQAVSFSAASDEPLFDEPGGRPRTHWQRTRVSALFPADIDLDILLVCLRDRIGADHIYSREIQAVADQNWVSAYRQQQQALIFADRLCICPSWCEPPPGKFATVILDPGLAFGTGTHPTTGLCLDWLAQQDLAGRSVIDFGCGSGILALAAARLGAAAVTAVDIDPQALEACRCNAEQNGLAAHIDIVHADRMNTPTADILLANVLFNPLLQLADEFAQRVRPGGRLVLSGLLPDQAQACLAAYDRCFNMQAPVFRDEWALLQGTRRDN